MAQGKKRGRPRKDPPEKMYFGIKCSKEESERIWKLINKAGARVGSRVGVSDFFLSKIGIR